jgi:hypothetical protein
MYHQMKKKFYLLFDSRPRKFSFLPLSDLADAD